MTVQRVRSILLDRSVRQGHARRRLGAVLLVLMIVAAACGSGDDDSSDSSVATDASAPREDTATVSGGSVGFDTAAEAEAPADRDASSDDEAVAEEGESAPAVEPQAGNSAGEVTSGSAGGQPTAQLPDLGREIIYTAELELASTDITGATREAIRTVEGRGGFLFSQDTRGGSGGSSVLVFKVLPDQFQAALNDLGSLGTVRSQSISADDVTAIVVDLESRINTAAASVERLRDLLDEANQLDVIATLENQLLTRETTLEQLRGQLRTVQNQVDLATITVYLTELLNRPSLALDASSFTGQDQGFSCFDAPGLRSGEEGDPVTICYRLVNTGDTPLVDISIDDPVLGASIANMVLVDGDVTQIDPGETVVLAYEFELTESLRLRTSASATGLDPEGNPLDDEVLATAATIRFEVIEDDGFPSFGDVLSGSLGALGTVALLIALAAVAIAPFLVVALVLSPLAWWAVRWFRQRRSARAAASATTAAATPAPTPPSAPAATATTGAPAPPSPAASTSRPAPPAPPAPPAEEVSSGESVAPATMPQPDPAGDA